MAEQSGISWTDATFNPWIGCTKVGPGCDNCYAEALMDKRWQRVTWGTGRPRLAPASATGSCRCCGRRSTRPSRWPTAGAGACSAPLWPTCSTTGDPAWRVELMRLITRTPHLDWMILTKRIGNAAAMLEAACQGVDGVGWQRNPWPMSGWAPPS